MSKRYSRGNALTIIAAAPVAIFAAGRIAVADTDDSGGSKAQYKYQDKPGAKGERCDGCSLWRAPNSCTIVKGKIDPKGYCIAYSPKSK